MHIAITGASSGIGEALARHYARQGHALTLVARRQELLDAIAAELDTSILTARADLSDLDHCTAWVDDAEATHGPIDLLVSNAGMQYVEPATGVGDERAERLFALNVLAPMRLFGRVVPGMVERGRGGIVSVSSIAGIVPTPGMAHYSASKAAIGVYCELLADELRGTGVHVLSVYPGPVETPLEKAARANLQPSFLAEAIPMGSPAELARRIDKAVQKKQTRLFYPAFYGTARAFRGTAQWLTGRLTPPTRS